MQVRVYCCGISDIRELGSAPHRAMSPCWAPRWVGTHGSENIQIFMASNQTQPLKRKHEDDDLAQEKDRRKELIHLSSQKPEDPVFELRQIVNFWKDSSG